jgi:protein TonB
MTSSPAGIAVSLAVHAAVIALLLHPTKQTIEFEEAAPPGTKVRIFDPRPPHPIGRPDTIKRSPPGKTHHAMVPPKDTPQPIVQQPAALAVASDETPEVVDEPGDGPADESSLGISSFGGAIGDRNGTGPGSIGPVAFAGEAMTPPQRLSGPDPSYTPQAIEHEVQGSMQVRCIVGLDGAVRDCRVVRGLPFMDREVVEALERRRYSPALLAGRPVEVEYLFRVELRLP